MAHGGVPAALDFLRRASTMVKGKKYEFARDVAGFVVETVARVLHGQQELNGPTLMVFLFAVIALAYIMGLSVLYQGLVLGPGNATTGSRTGPFALDHPTGSSCPVETFLSAIANDSTVQHVANQYFFDTLALPEQQQLPSPVATGSTLPLLSKHDGILAPAGFTTHTNNAATTSVLVCAFIAKFLNAALVFLVLVGAPLLVVSCCCQGQLAQLVPFGTTGDGKDTIVPVPNLPSVCSTPTEARAMCVGGQDCS